jgi:mRNA-degrading endonuclease toxin of MazEF toxin-antitoxin module
MAYKAGDVILIPFPYRDRLAESTRPAVVVSGDAYNQQGDLVIAAAIGSIGHDRHGAQRPAAPERPRRPRPDPSDRGRSPHPVPTACH